MRVVRLIELHYCLALIVFRGPDGLLKAATRGAWSFGQWILSHVHLVCRLLIKADGIYVQLHSPATASHALDELLQRKFGLRARVAPQSAGAPRRVDAAQLPFLPGAHWTTATSQLPHDLRTKWGDLGARCQQIRGATWTSEGQISKCESGQGDVGEQQAMALISCMLILLFIYTGRAVRVVTPPCNPQVFDNKVKVCLSDFNQSLETIGFHEHCAWPAAKSIYNELKNCVDDSAVVSKCQSRSFLVDEVFFKVHEMYFSDCALVQDPPPITLLMLVAPATIATIFMPLLCVYVTPSYTSAI